MKNIFYFSLKYLLRFYNYIFFRNIKIYGYDKIPKDGGILFSPNHQGAFLDPLLVGSMTPKKITSLTRSDVFGGPLQWFLDALQMLPVYRIRNGYSNLKKNDAIFEKCFDLLGSGKFLLMFSEGGHHHEYYLKNLSKGSSRLAFQAQKKYPKKKIYIQPVGINYGHHTQPRSSLHLVYGNPLLISKYTNQKKSEAENINLIREALQLRMKDCLWIPEDSTIYKQQKDCINSRTTKMDFFQLKFAIEAKIKQLSKRKKRTNITRFIAGILSIPNIIPLFITRKVVNKFKDPVFNSSMKYAMGVFLFPAYWILTSIIINSMFGNNLMALYIFICLLFLFVRQHILLS